MYTAPGSASPRAGARVSRSKGVRRGARARSFFSLYFFLFSLFFFIPGRGYAIVYRIRCWGGGGWGSSKTRPAAGSAGGRGRSRPRE